MSGEGMGSLAGHYEAGARHMHMAAENFGNGIDAATDMLGRLITGSGVTVSLEEAALQLQAVDGTLNSMVGGGATLSGVARLAELAGDDADRAADYFTQASTEDGFAGRATAIAESVQTEPYNNAERSLTDARAAISNALQTIEYARRQVAEAANTITGGIEKLSEGSRDARQLAAEAEAKAARIR